NTAMVLDTDSIFHGVDRIASVSEEELPPLRPGMVLAPIGNDVWTVRAGEANPVAEYKWEDLRFSVSWKAYCFRDEAERDAWRDHADDLTLDADVNRLVADLAERGRGELDL